MATSRNTPTELGYRWPAEWEPHAATWLSWPHNRNSWPDKFEPVPEIWRKLAISIAEHEDVHVLAGGTDVRDQAEAMVGSHRRISIHDIPTNDAWTRDHGPIFLTRPRGEPPALVDFGYNAWGGKYPPFDLDDQVPRRIAEELGYHRFEPDIVLEGGSIDGNGRGTVLTTEQCLLNPNRNPGLSRSEIERILNEYLGITNVLWLGSGIEGDDTDGHIDELARFVGPSKVVAAVEEDPSEVNYEPLRENFERLKRMKDEAGKPLDVIPVPMPRARYFRDQRLPCSYMNFYIANGLVILPFFGDGQDESIWTLFVKLFPDRRVLGMDAIDLVWGLGGFHCVTQQQPS